MGDLKTEGDEAKPQILAVKLGYNPNSSSIGIIVKIFLYHTMVISGLFGMIGFILNFKKKDKSGDQGPWSGR